jgi:hypothetical protein
LLGREFESTAGKGVKGSLNKIKAMSDKVLNSAKGQNYLQAAQEHLKRF